METIKLTQENKMNIAKVSSLSFSTDHVISKDGTIIGYRQIGSGPGLILVHGGMMASQNFKKLAEILSGAFTVYVPDRRGRGMSGFHGNDYCLARECEDIQALVNQTRAQNIFGLSSGAIVALQSTLEISSIHKVAIYEPPFSINDSTSILWSLRYENELAKGELAAAMLTVMEGTGDSSFLTKLPRFLLVPFIKLAIEADAKEIKSKGDVPIKALIPTIHFDLQLVLEMEGKLERFRALSSTKSVLLLGGSKSQNYLKVALDALSTILPTVKRVELKGLGHTAANNDDQPQVVAEELRRFFA
jgi:pimeloyl-ACP methyl ester carboxylesterase